MNILLIDDHPMVNSGLAAILEAEERFKVTGQVNTLDEAKNFIKEAALSKNIYPSLIILDITLGDENGLDFIPFLRDFCINNKMPVPPVLVCSVLEEPFRIQSALKMGAFGYISKTSSKNELLEAIDTVLRGENYLSGKHTEKLKKSLGLYAKFTERESEIFSMIKEKKTNKQIAEMLGLNFRTVENHVSNIYFKTGAANKEELLKL